MIHKLVSIVMLVIIFLIHPIQVIANYESKTISTYQSDAITGFIRFSEKTESSELRYLLRGPEGMMWVTENAIWLTHWGNNFNQSEEEANLGVHVKFTFPEKNNFATIVPEDPVEGSISYLMGTNRENWKTNLTMFSRMRYRDLYPGVDLVIQAGQDGFSWHYETLPGVDVSNIHFQISGVNAYTIVPDGTILSTPAGNLLIPPITLPGNDYQMKYLLPESSADSISLNSIENTYDLFSTEDLVFSTFLGGSANDDANDLVIDEIGNAYIVGSTPSGDFPVTPGSFDTSNTNTDAFVTKINIDTPALVYSTYIGGSGSERGSSISVENGIAYVVGDTNSPNFPLAGAAVLQDAFVLTLNQWGNDLIYSRLLGGTYEDRAYRVKVENNYAYLTGITNSNNFPVTDGSTYKNGGDIFVVKINSSGTIEYGTYLGGTDTDAGYGLDVQNGLVWITGETSSLNFGATPGVPPNIFVASLNSAGSMDSLRLIGGIGDERAYDLVLDSAGDVYIVGYTNSVNFPVTQGTYQGNDDAFLMKLNKTSTIFSTFVGGSNLDQGFGIDLDEFGGVIITGITNSDNFPVTTSAVQSTHAGNGDAFISRFFIMGSTPGVPTYSSFLGGTGQDRGLSLALDDTIYAHIIGETNSSDFPVTADALYSTLNGTQDAFLSILPVGPLPMISIQKTTNGEDANDAPGPYVYPGTPITWQYLVNNSGEVSLTEIQVTDNKGVTVSCPQTSLLAGTSMTCTASGTAVADQYSNMGTVTARTPYDTVIGDTDASHYFGAVPETTLVKKTNDVVVSQPSDLYIEETGNITWTYEVTNSGNVDLTGVTVVDDNGTPDNTGDDITVCSIPTLAAGATDTTTCALTGNAIPGPYSNLAVVVGTPPGGLADVTDEDVSHYFGSAPGISLVKKLDGNVTTSPGPYLLKDTVITWTYEVTNTGNVDLTNVTVIDDNGTPDTGDDRTACTGLTITAGATNVSSCSLSDTVKLGSYHNIATVTGTPPVGLNVTATADGYYYGANPVVEIEYSVNTDPADSSPGLYVYTGSTLNLSYVITNSGNVDLSGIAVTDAAGNTITCPFTTLSAGNSMPCTASMTALSGQQSVLATVTATPPSPLVNIQASDPIYYFGSSPSLSIDKKTNGMQGDSIPGVYLMAGSTVTWSYLVKNTGNVTLTGVTVVDDNGTPANLADDQIPTECNNITLTPNQEVTCTLSGTAIVGQYTNIATVSGNPPTPLSTVNASDTSHYFGATLSVSLIKQTNDEDAATTPGPLIPVDAAVDWTYSITNNSNVPVSFTVVDNPVVTITCEKNTLAAGENIICTASGTASAGQYTNTATVTATPPGGLAAFEASDTSHYFGVITGVEIIKSTNGQDANTAPGPFIKIGDPVNWTYQVTNTGNVDLTNVLVADDQGVAISCGGTTLAPQASMTCTASGTAVAGQYTNIGTVTASPPTGFSQVSDSDPSHYFGGDASINIEKFTNGNDNDAAPGIYILVGETVTWTYTVRNTGNVALENILLRDDKGTEDLSDDYSCTITSLAVGAEDTSTCSTSDLAEAGQYANTAYVSGDVVNMDGQVFDQDSSFYFGSDPGIQIIKKVNGEDANEPPGPYIPVGETVNFSYVISYVGDPYQLTSIEITDESGVIPTCPFDQLSGGEILTCEGQSSAGTGQQSDMVYVSATTWLDEVEPIELGVVTASDISHYYGYTLGIDLEKFTNGADVSDPPGIELPIDSQVTWTYEVTNTSNVTINSVAVTDDQEGLINCPKESLASSETMICSATGVVMEGQYSNEAIVHAEFEVNTEVTETLMDTDRSYYHGIPAFKVFIPLLMR